MDVEQVRLSLLKSRKGDLTIEHVIMMVILLVLLIVLVIYSGTLKQSASSLLERIIGVFTGS